MKAEITFKSGVQILVDADEFSTSRNRITREIDEMRWTTPTGWHRKLHTVALSEIVAVVAVRDEDEADRADAAAGDAP